MQLIYSEKLVINNPSVRVSDYYMTTHTEMKATHKIEYILIDETHTYICVIELFVFRQVIQYFINSN